MLARIFGYGNSTESSTFLVFLRFGSVEFSILAKCRSNQTRCQQHWGCVARALNSAALIHKVQLIQSPEEACAGFAPPRFAHTLRRSGSRWEFPRWPAIHRTTLNLRSRMGRIHTCRLRTRRQHSAARHGNVRSCRSARGACF